MLKCPKAVDLLKESCNTVQQIAYELGYENPKHFSRAFKRGILGYRLQILEPKFCANRTLKNG